MAGGGTNRIADSLGQSSDTASQNPAATPKPGLWAMLAGFVNAWYGTGGLVTWPAAADPADGVKGFAALRKIFDNLAIVDTILDRVHDVQTATGEADIDVSAAVYTTDYRELLKVTPGASSPLLELEIELDLQKTTTGLHAVQTAADTADFILMSKVDGTNWRAIQSVTQVVAATSPTGVATGRRFSVGPLAVAAELSLRVLLSAERNDVEIPYRITYRKGGATAPTITAVAA